MRLQPGDLAPAFELMDQSNRRIALTNFCGHKVLVYFYPKADTPGCTAQACAVRDAATDLQRVGVAVLGISPDLPPTQAKFAAKYGLSFPLLSDPDHKTAEAYGVWGQKHTYGKSAMGIIRSAFLIDEGGCIQAAWVPVKPEEMVPNTLAAVARGNGAPMGL